MVQKICRTSLYLKKVEYVEEQSQDAYYFSADEVYSFHIGIMERIMASFFGVFIIYTINYSCNFLLAVLN